MRLLLLMLFPLFALAETLPATGSGLNWSVTLPAGFTNTELRVACYDCDYADEATLAINGGPAMVLFGADFPARDGRVVSVPIPVELAPGANTLTFACARRAGCIRIDGIDVVYTPPRASEWTQTAKTLEASGWVPPWLTPDDRIWVVSREDTDPARALVCLQDAQTEAQYVAWVESTLAGFPTTPAPPVSDCERAWCFSSGVLRQSAINSACR